jgi:hypothetical protein
LENPEEPIPADVNKVTGISIYELEYTVGVDDTFQT